MHPLFQKIIDWESSDVFSRYEKEFAGKLAEGLAMDYVSRKDEPEMVETVENLVNNADGLHDKYNSIRLATRGIFIHGNKSQVSFNCYGGLSQRELGDLIFIISIVYNGQKYFEKLTIAQFKKDSRNQRTSSWSIDEKQLYLLSRFPTFRGLRSSLIPSWDFSLPNYSGALGSYALLFKPGDFSFVSATGLSSFLGNEKNLNQREIYKMHSLDNRGLIPTLILCYYPYVKLSYFQTRLTEEYLSENLFNRNSHFSSNAFDFSHKYLRFGIGEPIFMKWGQANAEARKLLLGIFSKIKSQAGRDPKNAAKLREFCDGFYQYSYADGGNDGETNLENNEGFEDGGIGIIHTTINFGE